MKYGCSTALSLLLVFSSAAKFKKAVLVCLMYARM